MQIGGPGTLAEFNQLSRDANFAPGQVVSSLHQCSLGHPGLIGKRSMIDLGAIGDNLILALGGGNASGQHDQLFNSQALEAAYRKLPLPKDSERPRSYIPVNFLLPSAFE
jgi:CCR4-NOT transcription complex subunit 3